MQRVFLLGYNPLLQDISGVILREHFSLYIELRHQYSNNVLKHHSFSQVRNKLDTRYAIIYGHICAFDMGSLVAEIWGFHRFFPQFWGNEALWKAKWGQTVPQARGSKCAFPPYRVYTLRRV